MFRIILRAENSGTMVADNEPLGFLNQGGYTNTCVAWGVGSPGSPFTTEPIGFMRPKRGLRQGAVPFRQVEKFRTNLFCGLVLDSIIFCAHPSDVFLNCSLPNLLSPLEGKAPCVRYNCVSTTGWR